MVHEKPELQKEYERLLGRYAEAQVLPSGTQRVQQIYSMIQDPNGGISATKTTLRLFVKIDTVPIVRESLLHKNRDMIVIASDGLAQIGQKGTKDKAALHYLIRVLAQKRITDDFEPEPSMAVTD